MKQTGYSDIAAIAHDNPKIDNDGLQKYVGSMYKMLVDARTEREQARPLFGNLSFSEYVQRNEELANTIIYGYKDKDGKMTKDKTAREFAMGTLENKMEAVLANVDKLGLGIDVESFDEDNNRDARLEKVFEDSIFESRRQEPSDNMGYDFKRRMHQLEMLKQGIVIVYDEWTKKYQTQKETREGDSRYTFSLEPEMVVKQSKAYECAKTTMLNPRAVYFMNINTMYVHEQPGIFFAVKLNYKTARSKYGKFDNWKYVKKGQSSGMNAEHTGDLASLYEHTGFRFSDDLGEDEVEVVTYMSDKFHDNEYQMFINGIPMYAKGFPMTNIIPDGEYPIAVGRLGSTTNFMYGKSFVTRGSVQALSEVSDVFINLMVRKGRRSIDRPYANLSNQYVTPDVLDPGSLVHGFDPSVLVPIGDVGNGVTSGEFALWDRMQNLIENNTVSSVFQGQEGQTEKTATEVAELREKAGLALRLIIASCCDFEVQLGYLRLRLISEHWFKPVRDKPVGGTIGSRYRNTSRKGALSGEKGYGIRRVVVADELPDPDSVAKLEALMGEDTQEEVEVIVVKASELKNIKRRWYIVCNPQAKKGDAFDKAEFREELADLQALAGLGLPINMEGIMAKASRAYETSTKKLFKQQSGAAPTLPGPEQLAEPGPSPGGRSNTPGAPSASTGGAALQA